MEIILIILTSALISAFLFIAYRLGYKDGSSQKESDSFELNKQNAKILKQYANFMAYNGDERR